MVEVRQPRKAAWVRLDSEGLQVKVLLFPVNERAAESWFPGTGLQAAISPNTDRTFFLGVMAGEEWKGQAAAEDSSELLGKPAHRSPGDGKPSR